MPLRRGGRCQGVRGRVFDGGIGGAVGHRERDRARVWAPRAASA